MKNILKYFNNSSNLKVKNTQISKMIKLIPLFNNIDLLVLNASFNLLKI